MNSTKPRLLILASTYPRWHGDPEPGFVHELAKRLTEDFDVAVLGPHAAGAHVEESMDGVRVHRYRYAPARLEALVNDGGIVTNLKRTPWKWLLVPTFLMGLAWRLWRLNRVYRADVIHAHWLFPQGFIVAVLSKMAGMPPMVVTSHGSDLFALKGTTFRALKRFVVRSAAAVTVVSHAMRDELGRIGADTANLSVEPMGVDLRARFTPGPIGERSQSDILFVGRLVEKKGLRHLIHAMPAIIQNHASATLLIAGFGPDEMELREVVRLLGIGNRVRFLGAISQSELPGLYRRAAVLVAPFVVAASGDREGLGLVVVEAVGCGCPVVVTDIAPVREVLSESRAAVFLTSANPAEIASAVSVVLSDPGRAEGFAVAARMGVLRLDWENRASAYSSLLSRVARSPKNSAQGSSRLEQGGRM